MKVIENAATTATYKTVWIAGPTIKYTKKIRAVKEVVESLILGYEQEEKQKKAMSRSVSRN